MAKRKSASRSKRSKTGTKKAAAHRTRPTGSPSSRARAAAKRRPKKSRPKARKAKKAAPPRARRAARLTARPAARRQTRSGVSKATAAKAPVKKAAPQAGRAIVGRIRGKAPRLDRMRRTLDDTVPTPPSSLDMNRRGSAVRTGRAEMAQSRQNLGEMGALTRGDVDADAENAYFSGDEAPGGDNPTPDQDIVDEIGRAIGIEYQDNEELRASDKVADRDKHRWELDPASAEDYDDR